MTTQLQLSQIRIDGGTQPRERLDGPTQAEYADDMQNGAQFPPVVVFFDGTDYWLADGFHRWHAAQQVGLTAIAADVRQGTLQDAQWYSYSVNQSHGLRRTNEDKKRAVLSALQHSYASRYSNVDIAKHCGVSEITIRRYRESLSSTMSKIENDNRIVTRNGTTYTMSTANIGKPITPPDNDEPLSDYEEDIARRYVESALTHTTNALDDKLEILQELSIPDTQPIVSRNDHVMRVMGSSESPEWYTPRAIVDKVIAFFEVIHTDPCSNSRDTPNVPAEIAYTKADNGLTQPWKGNVYMNPPYGDEIPEWTERMVLAYQREEIDQAIALLPGRIDTLWFQPLYHYLICHIKGRLKFENSPYPAPFPNVIVYLGTDTERFIQFFGELGPIMKRVG